MPAGTQLPARRQFHLVPPPRWPGPDSGWWLVGVAAAFSLCQLLLVAPRMGLSWDETVYVSQVSGHAPAAFFDPARARGVSLLVAPVALVTASVAVLRGYLALLSGLGLLGALWVWRPLRPAWVLALAGVAFGSLWVAQYYGPQAMPDEWVALSGLAAVGFFLRAAGPGGRGPHVRPGGRGPLARAGGLGPLAGLAVSLALAALFRPGDALFLAAPLALAVAAVRAWRRWPLLAAVVAGTAAGATEWAVEAYLRFGSLLTRLRLAGAEQGGFGLHLAVWAELRALNGPTLCRPCTIGWRYPVLSLWWLALPVLVVLGVLAARRAGRLGSAALPAVCALSVALQYLFLIGYAAPRFLLPAYALLAIPVADCLAWMITGVRADLRLPTAVLVGWLLLAQVAAQQVVLHHEVRGTVIYHNDYRRIVADLRGLGVRPPCVIKGEQFIPIAYDGGCASTGTVRQALLAGDRVAVLAYPQHRPGYLRGWPRYRLPGTRILRLVAYLPAAGRPGA